MTRFRKKLWLPTLGQRQSYEDWLRADRRDLMDQAEARAERLSSLPVRNPLPTDVEKDLERLFEEGAKDL